MTQKSQIEGRPVRILIVDDEEIVLSFAHDALEDSGYEIELAGDGNTALEKIRRGYFDFILTDIRMPECDGIELARLAREIIPSVGIIFMTGYANLNSAKDAIKEGAYDYIMKPFELNEIRQAVKNAISKRQTDTEKTLSNELNRLSDLNQIMYTVSDSRSLMRLSLGFALMQGKTSVGSVIFKTGHKNEIGMISVDNSSESGFDESTRKFDSDVFNIDTKDLKAPFVIKSVEEHPLFAKYPNEKTASLLTPPWFKKGYSMVNIPLKRGPKLYGFLILGCAPGSDEIKQSELKLLGITASQIAISLENIILLEESREAYKRLKDLQEHSLQLEKMAVRGKMSAEIGHELNNFLGVIVGNLSLMRHHLEKKEFDQLEKYLTAVIQNFDNIKKFTESLVNYTGVDSNKEYCDINITIRNVIEYLKAQKQFQDIEIILDLSETEILSVLDTTQIQQLLYNLINNAAEAVLDNEAAENKKIEIKTSLNKQQDHFAIYLKDNGRGIDPELLQKAFNERFTTKKTGHGFGLLICRKVIENHRGQLHIDSRPGQGTIIGIEFPRQVPVSEAAPVA